MLNQPETLRQARRWDGVKARYLTLGLCSPCAAQAAWGHQIGFSRIMPPCDECFPIVIRLPGRGAGDWRSDQASNLNTRPSEGFFCPPEG